MPQQTPDIDLWLPRFKEFLAQESCSRWATKSYSIVARNFIRFAARRALALESVQPSDLKRYLSACLLRYRRKHKRNPKSRSDWYWHHICGVQVLLRLARGQWPPPSAIDLRLQRFKTMLQSDQLRPDTVGQYLEQARLFLTYLDRLQIQPENVKSEDVEAFIQFRLRAYRNRYGRSPRRFVRWRCEYTKAIHRLLRDVQGEWSPLLSVDPDLNRFRVHLAERGFRPNYSQDYCLRAGQFLHYLRRQGIDVARVQPLQVAAYFRVALVCTESASRIFPRA